MGDWCECRKPDFPEVLEADYLTAPGVCRVCGKKRDPCSRIQPHLEIKAYCPERHELKRLEIIFNINWKKQVVHYISGYCEVCNKVFCVGDDMTQLGVGK